MTADRLLGEWWDPSDPSKKYPGILRGSDTSNPSLELLADIGAPESDERPLMYGVAGGTAYSLIGLTRFMRSMVMASNWTINEQWHVQYALKDVYAASVEQQFDGVSFTVQGIQDWSRISGIIKTLTQAYGSQTVDTYIEHKNPDPVILNCRGMLFSFVSFFNHPNKRWSVSLEEDTQVIVTSQQPKTIAQWWDEAIAPIQRLVQFSIKNGGTVRRVAVKTDNIDRKNKSFGNSWAQLMAWSKKYDFNENQSPFERPIFMLSDFSEDYQRLNNWFDLYEKYKEPFDGLLRLDPNQSTYQYGYFVNARLLERLLENYQSYDLITKEELNRVVAAVQEIVGDKKTREAFIHKLRSMGRQNSQAPVREALARWCSYIASFKDNPEMQNWTVAKIVDTRNCFAHHSESACRNTATCQEIPLLHAVVRTLIDFEVGGRVGIPIEVIAGRLKDSYEMRKANKMRELWADLQGNSSMIVT